MATIDWTTNPTGLFFRAGKLVKKINAYLALAQTTYPADLNEISAGYDNANLTYQIDGLAKYYRGLQNAVPAVRTRLAGYVDATFTDRATVLEPLDVQTASINQVLPALLQAMLDASQAVKRCTVTVGSVVASASNLGNGTILVTKVLDGFNPPLRGGPSSIRWNGLNSELAANSETMLLQCVADSQSDGAPEGGERFNWVGGPANSLLDWQDEGSGNGPTVTVANSSTLVNDGSFENWTGTGSNTPSAWTITGGTAGTHIFREATNVYRGLYAARFTGDGITTSIGLSQLINPSSLKPRRMYNLSLRVKASAVPAAGNLQVNFTGTGYTPAATEQITLPAGQFPTAYTLYNFFISTPAIIPANWALALACTGPLSSGVNVYLDSLALKEVSYHGGVGLVAVAGSNRFMRGDKFTFTTANDGAGVWQSFFRRYYDFQLPSVAAGSETISDALAS